MTDIRDDAPSRDDAAARSAGGARDAYAPERETTEGTVYTVTGGDWDTLLDEEHDDRIVINMGPQHPSTHGVLRLVLELERSEEHTSELQSRQYLVCRLLLEKKK